MTLDELLLEWSYRSEKGYPSLDSPSDISLLKEILEELKLPSEVIIESITDDMINSLEDPQDLGTPGDSGFEDSPVQKEKERQFQQNKDTTPTTEPEEPQDTTLGSTVYDDVIRRHLGLSEDQPIPRSKNSYPFPGSGGATFSIQVKSDDLKYWKDFWELTPPKAGKTTGGTKGSGFGEISLYWLYNHSNSNQDVKDTRGADNPDLKFNGIGVEVKAYDKGHTGKQKLGRFGQDYEILKMLGVIFGINTLTTLFKGVPEGKKRGDKDINPLTWDGKNLADAMQEFINFKNIDIDQLAEIPGYDLFKMIKENIEFLDTRLGEYRTAEEGARKMSLEFIKPKIARKPGDGGFITNVLIDGDCRFWQVDYDRVVKNEDSLNHIKASQGAMEVDFEALFG